MPSRHSATCPHAQQGAAALIMLIILVLGASYLFVSELNRSSSQTGRDKITAAALAQAKEALIGRAATDDNRPGSLPCPDTQDDGSSEGILNKDCNAYIGRLPWRTLGLPDILDGAGERLWYALSPAFRDDDSAEPVNPFETHPDLTLDSPGGAGQYAALIIAPGAGVCGQDRAGNNHYDPAQYLELDNGDKNNDYVSRPDGGSDCQSSNFNDKVIGITPAELRRVTQKRIEHIQSEVGAKLREYFKRCHFLPWAAPFGDPSTLTPFISDSTNKLRKGFFPLDQAAPADWGKDCNGAGAGTVTAPQIIRFRQNHWDLKFPNVFSAPLYYAVGNGYTQGQEGNCAAAGSCLSVSGNSVAAVLIAPGVALAGQTRPSAAVADYLEGGNASIADDIFEVGTASASFNDILMQVNP